MQDDGGGVFGEDCGVFGENGGSMKVIEIRRVNTRLITLSIIR